MEERGHSVVSSESLDQTVVASGKATTLKLLIAPDNAPNFAMRKFTMAPGGGMPKHTNGVEHEQYVLQGRATIGIDDESYEVKEGDVVFIPAGAPHWYEAHGEEDFEFICIVPNTPDKVEILDR